MRATTEVLGGLWLVLEAVGEVTTAREPREGGGREVELALARLTSMISRGLAPLQAETLPFDRSFLKQSDQRKGPLLRAMLTEGVDASPFFDPLSRKRRNEKCD